MHADLIIHNAGQLVTCRSDGKPKRGADMLDVGIVENGAVAIVDGVITAVGTSDDILRDHDAAHMIDASGRVVCPGFVDPHTHIVFAGDRLNEFELKIKGAEYLEILAAGGGILSTVRQTRSASVDELVEQSMVRLDKMLACGTTTCEIKTGYGLDLDTEMKMLEVIAELDRRHPIDIVPTFLAAHAVPAEYKNRTDEFIDLIAETWLPHCWDWYSTSDLSKKSPCYVDIFCEQGAFSLAQMQRLIAAVDGYKGRLGFKAHVDQFNNLGGSRTAIAAGAASIDHLDKISDDEIALLAASDTIGIVIPTEGFNGGKTEFANARKLVDAGCALALSTDYNPGSAPCPSQPMAMAIACRYQKLLPSEALNAATINAAHAIGLGGEAGSIEVGKRADVLVLETRDYRQMANEFGGNLVSTVIKRGVVTAPTPTAR